MHELGFDHGHMSPEAQQAIADTIWAADNVELVTVGVDVGSSTSHLMFAKVHLQRLTTALYFLTPLAERVSSSDEIEPALAEMRALEQPDWPPALPRRTARVTTSSGSLARWGGRRGSSLVGFVIGISFVNSHLNFRKFGREHRRRFRRLDATLLNAPRRRQVIDRSRHRHHGVSAIALLREPR